MADSTGTGLKGIGGALTRKFGPLPAWVWAIIAGGGLYYYREHTAAATGTALDPSQVAATTPQPDTTLEPGESVYDPNTGQLETAPGGDTSGGGGTDPSDEIGQLASAIAAAIEALAPASNDPGDGTDNPTTPASAKNKPGKNAKKNANAAPGKGKPEKPSSSPGGPNQGKRKNKGKLPQGTSLAPKGAKARVRGILGAGGAAVPRSKATIKGKGGHDRKNAAAATAAAVKGRPRSQANTVAKSGGARPRPSLGNAGMIRNRPVASATPKTRASSGPAPRPSAPAPRPAPRRQAPPPRPAPKPAPKRKK